MSFLHCSLQKKRKKDSNVKEELPNLGFSVMLTEHSDHQCKSTKAQPTMQCNITPDQQRCPRMPLRSVCPFLGMAVADHYIITTLGTRHDLHWLHGPWNGSVG